MKKPRPEPAKFSRCHECGVTELVCKLRARPDEKGAPCCFECDHEQAGP